MEQSAAGKLPVDITRIIMGVLVSEREMETLHAGGRVCSSWRYGARPYKFRHIRLDSQQCVDSLDDLLASVPDIAGYIQQVRFHGKKPEEHRGTRGSGWILDAPLQLASKLPVLRTIRIHELFDIQDKPSSRFFEGLASFTSVTQLHLLHCSCREDFVFRCAGVLPNLRHFEVCNPATLPLGFVDTSALDASYPLVPDSMQLTTLRCMHARYDQDKLVHWLVTAPHRASLRHLAVDIDDVSLISLSRALREVGPNLERLELQVYFPPGYVWRRGRGAISAEKLLSPCTALKDFTVGFTGATDMYSALPLLRGVRARCIERVRINLIHFIGGGSFPNLTELYAILQGENFKSMQTARIVYVGPLSLETFRAHMTSRLPAALEPRMRWTHTTYPGLIFDDFWSDVGPCRINALT